MTYDELLIEATDAGAIVKEAYFKTRKSDNLNNRIAIHKDLSNYEKTFLLAKELGNYYRFIGDKNKLRDINKRKKNFLERQWEYNKKIGIIGLINAFRYGCSTRYEMAKYLNVSIEYLNEAISYYEHKYGSIFRLDDYIIYFSPIFYIGVALN